MHLKETAGLSLTILTIKRQQTFNIYRCTTKLKVSCICHMHSYTQYMYSVLFVCLFVFVVAHEELHLCRVVFPRSRLSSQVTNTNL